MFREDLLNLLQIWHKNRERVLLMMNTNKHIIYGILCSKLTAPDLNIHETVHAQVAGTTPNTWFHGSDPIGGIWTFSNMDIIGASYLPYHVDLGNHRPIVANITI